MPGPGLTFAEAVGWAFGSALLGLAAGWLQWGWRVRTLQLALGRECVRRRALEDGRTLDGEPHHCAPDPACDAPAPDPCDTLRVVCRADGGEYECWVCPDGHAQVTWTETDDDSWNPDGN